MIEVTAFLLQRRVQSCYHPSHMGEKWNHHNSLQHWWISTEQNLLLMIWSELSFEKYELHHSLFKAGYHSSVLRQSLRDFDLISFTLSRNFHCSLYWPPLSALKLVQTRKSTVPCEQVHTHPPLSPGHTSSPGTLSPSVSVLQTAWGQRGLSSPALPACQHSGLPHRPLASAHCCTDTALTHGEAHHVFISPSISAALNPSLFSFSPQPSPPVVSAWLSPPSPSLAALLPTCDLSL